MKNLDKIVKNNHFWTLKINHKHKTSWKTFIQGKSLILGKNRGFECFQVVTLPALLPELPPKRLSGPWRPSEKAGVQHCTENHQGRSGPSCSRCGQWWEQQTSPQHAEERSVDWRRALISPTYSCGSESLHVSIFTKHTFLLLYEPHAGAWSFTF